MIISMEHEVNSMGIYRKIEAYNLGRKHLEANAKNRL